MKSFKTVLSAVAAGVCCAAASAHSAEPSWPGEEWDMISSKEAALDQAALQDLQTYAFEHEPEAETGAHRRTDGLVVIKDGKLVYEGYARGYDKDMRHLSWSMAKSFTNALYGIASHQGLVDIDQRIVLPDDWQVSQSKVSGITYKNLLHMASGIQWEEGYEYAPIKSTVVAMLYTRSRGQMAAFVADQGPEFQPGTHFEYSSGDTNLLSGLLKSVVGQGAYDNYPWVQLFDPLGMKNVTWEQDASGTFVGSSYIYATPRDYARFGYLMLNDGVWNGKRLLPEGWVDFSCTVNPAYMETFKAAQDSGDSIDSQYGAQFWLNAELPEIGLEKVYKDAPADTCMALGHWRQMIAVIPSHNMVVVRVAHDVSTTGAVVNNKVIDLAIRAFSGQ